MRRAFILLSVLLFATLANATDGSIHSTTLERVLPDSEPATISGGGGMAHFCTADTGSVYAIGGATEGGRAWVYNWTGATPVKLADPAGAPSTGTPGSATWSPDCTRLIFNIASTMHVWARNGDTLSLSTTWGLSSTGRNDVRWGPGTASACVAVAGSNSGTQYQMYYRTGDTTYTGNWPTPQPTSGGGEAIAWHPSGSHVAYLVSTSSGFFVRVFAITNTATCATSGVATVSAGSGTGTSGRLSWSADGSYVAASNGAGSLPSHIYVFEWDGSTLTKVAESNDTGGTGTGVAWSPDGNYLVAGEQNAYSEIAIYQFVPSNGTIHRIGWPDSSVNLPGRCFAVDWTTGGKLMCGLANSGAPRFWFFTTELGDVPPPAVTDAPTVTATLDGLTVNVSWTSVENADTYKIYRASRGNVPTNDSSYLLSSGHTLTYVVDATVAKRTHYCYAVSGVNDIGEGPLSSNEACVKVLSTPIDLLGDEGAIYAGDKDALAAELSISADSLGFLYGLIFALGLAGLGFALATPFGAPLVGAGIGLTSGLVLGLVLEFFPVWLVALTGAGFAAAFLIVPRRG